MESSPIPLTRLDVPPRDCPNCGRRQAVWHHYKLIPSAPAAGCGSCGHVVYITEDRLATLRAQAQASLPKATAEKAGKGKQVGRGRRR